MRTSSRASPAAFTSRTTWRPGQGSHCACGPRAKRLPSISQITSCPWAVKLSRWRAGGMSGSRAMMVPFVGVVIRPVGSLLAAVLRVR